MNEILDKLDVLLVCGNYASGKSTLANKYFKDWNRINRNEIRAFLKSMTGHTEAGHTEAGDAEVGDESAFSQEMEHLVRHIELVILKYLLEKNQKVVIDNTSVTRKSRHRYIQEVQRERKSIGCIFLDADVHFLLERNARRPEAEQVPESVISDLHARHEHPRKDEGFAYCKLINAAQ